jgi:hypothetical protein
VAQHPSGIEAPLRRRGGRPPFYSDEVNRRDRDRVITLVRRVGDSVLRFTLQDVKQAHRTAPPHLALERPQHLARHVNALVGTVIARAERECLPRLASERDQCQATADGTTTSDGQGSAGPSELAEARVPRSTSSFVLSHREAVLHAGPPQLDDLERAYLALWIATQVLGQTVVPTAAVSAVSDVITDLVRQSKAQVSNPLTALAKRQVPLVRKHPVDESGWVRWEPLAGPPNHPQLGAWTERMRGQGLAVHELARVGHATGNALVRELVDLALDATVSPEWPVGHSVTVTDLDAIAGADHRAAEITAALRRAGRSLGDTLGDVTKVRIVSGMRVQQHVAKVSGPGGRGTLYDVPSRPGYERRILIAPYRRLMQDASSSALAALAREIGAARGLEAPGQGQGGLRAAASGGPGWTWRTTGPGSLDSADPQQTRECHQAYAHIAAARQLVVICTLEDLLAVARALSLQAALLSTGVRKHVRARELAIQSALEQAGGAATRTRLQEALAAAGLASDAENTQRPLLTGSEYAAFCPSEVLGKRRAAVVLANATTLRRYPNPRYTSKRDPDPVRAAPTAVDRLDALLYLADTSGGRTLPIFQAARRVLGLDVRDHRLVLPLLGSRRRADRQLALAVLVSLGAPEAIDACLGVLADEAAPADHVADALHGLLILRRVTPSEWPERVRNAANGLLRATVRDVVFAARDGRWLLQP